MANPSSWELFQSVLIGTVSGIIASGVVNQGLAYVAILSFVLWILLTLALQFARPVFEWIDRIGANEEDEDRPYEDVRYAS